MPKIIKVCYRIISVNVLLTATTMPMLEIATNVPKEKVTPDVLTTLSKMVAEMLGKSETVRLICTVTAVVN